MGIKRESRIENQGGQKGEHDVVRIQLAPREMIQEVVDHFVSQTMQRQKRQHERDAQQEYRRHTL